MITTTKEETYYLNKLSLFMQQNEHIFEQNKILIKLLQNTDDTIENIFAALNIFKTDYEPKDYNKNSTEYDILDKIGGYYGLNRKILYKSSENVSEPKTLTNEEFLLLIRLTIIKNNFGGTIKDMVDMYQNIGITIEVANQDNNVVYLQLVKPQNNGFLKNIFLYTDLFELTYGLTYNKLITN